MMLESRHAGAMQPYSNHSADSGVSAFELGADYIDVEFRGGRVYRYSHARAGQIHVERMKQLARAGRGLSSYIGQYVHELHDR
jgi:hypothetical protein